MVRITQRDKKRQFLSNEFGKRIVLEFLSLGFLELIFDSCVDSRS